MDAYDTFLAIEQHGAVARSQGETLQIERFSQLPLTVQQAVREHKPAILEALRTADPRNLLLLRQRLERGMMLLEEMERTSEDTSELYARRFQHWVNIESAYRVGVRNRAEVAP